MTDDYKEQLLNYVTGNLIIESQESNSFRNSSTFQNNLTNALREAGIITELIEDASLKALTSDTTSNYILYGNYGTGTTINKYGFIVVCNQEGGIEKVFTSYDSGTRFSDILSLEYAEDGNIYGVDRIYTEDDMYLRVILLNNVALKTSTGYSCKLRASYYFPTEYTYFIKPYEPQGQGTSFIKKVNGEATYFMVGSLNRKVCLLKFVINVGSTNEWALIQGANEVYQMYTTDFIIEKTGDTPVIHLYYQPDDTSNTLCYDYYNGETLTRQNTYSIGTYAKDIRIKSSNEVYISSSTISNRITKLILYELNNGVLNTLYSLNIPETFNYPFLLNYTNNILFGTAYVLNDSIYGTINIAYDGTEVVVSDFIEKDQDKYVHPCIIQNTYALYKFISQDENSVHQQSIVIYDNSYSGESYSNYNLLVALHGELYSGNGIIFARSLYNKSTLNNVTASILEVPFNYINDISIDTQNLLSATQLEMIVNNNSITKNIYENLFINFINTLNVIDEDTDTSFINVANYINTNINIGTQTNYNNTKCSKFRINYEDETTSINTLEWLPINKYNKTTQITFYADKNITSIDLISEDETTVYLNIPVEVEIGKTYTIKQKVRTGDKLTPVQLQYNNENVNYNNEPVMVYTEEV